MEDKIYGRVYGVECLINHKIYVGQTTRRVEKRVSEHRRARTSLGADIRRYGWKNFVWVVLGECTSRKELDAVEIRWIARLDCKVPKGYNRTDGGEGIRGLVAKINTELESTELTPEQFGRYVEFIRSLPGYVPTAEDFAKQSKSKRKVVFPNLDVELIRQDLTYREIARRLGISKSNVLDKLSGTRPIDKEMALAIREILQVEMPIEELFAKISDDGTIENATTFAKNRRIVFPNLEAELKAQNISHWELARRLNMNRVTLGNKLNGRNNLDKETAQAIYEFLQVETSLEVLFARAEEFPVKTKPIAQKKKPVVHYGAIIYPNLLAELKEHQLTYKDLACILGNHEKTIQKKMHGIYRLDRKTALAIKELLQVEMSVEELFMKADGICAEMFDNPPVGEKKVAFPNLDAELERQHLTYLEIARQLNVHRVTVSRKLRGAYPLDEKTALAIREILQVETPLEILFARADEGTSAPPVE